MENRFYNYKKKCLRDEEIIKALKQSIEDYNDGAIIEVWSTCQEIANAIHDFDDDYKV